MNQLSGGGIVAKGVGNGDEQFALDAHLGFRFYVRNAGGVTVAGAQTGPNVGGSNVGGNWQMDGLWHHLVGVCDQVNSNILLYVDGSLIGPNVITNGVVPPLVYALDLGHTSTGTNGVIYTQVGIREPSNAYYNANSVSIGSRNKNSSTTGYTLNFNGVVDEVALYNYALSPLQVSNHFAVAKSVQPSINVQLVSGHPQIDLVWRLRDGYTPVSHRPHRSLGHHHERRLALYGYQHHYAAVLSAQALLSSGARALRTPGFGATDHLACGPSPLPSPHPMGRGCPSGRVRGDRRPHPNTTGLEV